MGRQFGLFVNNQKVSKAGGTEEEGEEAENEVGELARSQISEAMVR